MSENVIWDPWLWKKNAENGVAMTVTALNQISLFKVRDLKWHFLFGQIWKRLKIIVVDLNHYELILMYVDIYISHGNFMWKSFRFWCFCNVVHVLSRYYTHVDVLSGFWDWRCSQQYVIYLVARIEWSLMKNVCSVVPACNAWGDIK